MENNLSPLAKPTLTNPKGRPTLAKPIWAGVCVLVAKPTLATLSKTDFGQLVYVWARFQIFLMIWLVSWCVCVLASWCYFVCVPMPLCLSFFSFQFMPGTAHPPDPPDPLRKSAQTFALFSFSCRRFRSSFLLSLGSSRGTAAAVQGPGPNKVRVWDLCGRLVNPQAFGAAKARTM